MFDAIRLAAKNVSIDFIMNSNDRFPRGSKGFQKYCFRDLPRYFKGLLDDLKELRSCFGGF